MKYEIFEEPPKDFHVTLEVASCFCEYEDKVLFMRRHVNKSQGNTWGVPAGKLEVGETPRMCVIREVYEEVGLDVDDDKLEKIGKLYIRLPHVDYAYHMFHKRFDTYPTINLNLEEHHEALWTTLSEASQLPLISGGSNALSYYQRFISSKG